MRTIEVEPAGRAELFDALQRKLDAIRAAGRGTFFREGRHLKNSMVWKHKAYSGQVAIKRLPGHALSARIRSSARTGEWQLTSAFLGFVDRHFGDAISVITIRYG